MKSTARVLALLMAVMLLAGILAIPAAADMSSAIASTKKGTVKLLTAYYDGDNNWVGAATGTGFVVGRSASGTNDVLVTNWHVLSAAYARAAFENDTISTSRTWILLTNCTFHPSTGEPDRDASIECEVMRAADDTRGYPDYAVLRAKSGYTTYSPLPLKKADKAADGTQVIAVGFPGDAELLQSTSFGVDNMTSTDGIISQHLVDSIDGTQEMMMTAQISGGSSGGPLVTTDGEVVGITTFSTTKGTADTTRYYAIYIDNVFTALDELGVTYTLDGKQKGPGATNQTTAPATQPTATAPAPTPTEPQPAKDEFPVVPVVIAVAAVALIAIAVAIVMAGKKRGSAGGSGTPKLCGRDGGVISVPAQGLMAGRETDCTLRMGANEKGVSRHHFRVDVRGDKLYITDLGSSYGTYVNGGKLAPNSPVELKRGDGIGAGSPAAMYTVV